MRILHDKTGAAAVEFAIVAPVILLLLLGCLAVFDMYRSNARLEQASLIVADMVSRETALDGGYAKRLYAVFGELSETTNVPNALRLTSIANREGRYTADWSVQMGRADLLAPGGLYLDEIPALSDQDSVILIETGTIYITLSSIFGIETVLFRNRKFIRPRFINATVFSG